MTAWRATAAIVFFACATASADDNWTLTTADFKTRPVTPRGVDGDALAVATDGVEQKVPLNTVVSLTRGDRPKSPAGLVLCVDDGQRLVGVPSRIDGMNLIWAVAGVGDVAVPVEAAIAIVRDRATPDAGAAAATEDVAKLLSGDAVRGILSDVSADAFAFTPAAGGDPVQVSPTAVASIAFAAPPGGRKPPATPAFLVRAGASVLSASALQLNGDKLTLAGGRDIVVPLADVTAIEHTGGPVAWLSARRPTESTQTPYLGGPLPARFDTDVLGKPIRIGGVTYAHGIGVHSRSKLVFDVLPGDKTFRTRYAIDGSLGRADVDVCVSVDGRVLHEQKGFKAGVVSPVVTADVSGAKTITLEVGYGQGYDVQDRLNWIEPAMVRAAK